VSRPATLDLGPLDPIEVHAVLQALPYVGTPEDLGQIDMIKIDGRLFIWRADPVVMIDHAMLAWRQDEFCPEDIELFLHEGMLCLRLTCMRKGPYVYRFTSRHGGSRQYLARRVD
jgi:hypothetical protein